MDKITEIENEIKKTQYNKNTEGHIGWLKAKIAKLKWQVYAPKQKKEQDFQGFNVEKKGNARISFIGFPSVGKSSLLNILTNTHSKVSE